MTETEQILKEALELAVSKMALSRALGAEYSTVRQWYKTTRTPRVDNIMKLKRYIAITKSLKAESQALLEACIAIAGDPKTLALSLGLTLRQVAYWQKGHLPTDHYRQLLELIKHHGKLLPSPSQLLLEKACSQAPSLSHVARRIDEKVSTVEAWHSGLQQPKLTQHQFYRLEHYLEELTRPG